MAKTDVGKYIDELREFSSGKTEMDLYSLKEELVNLNKSSKIFENFEKESMLINKDTLEQVQDLGLLIRIKKLASEIKKKSNINDRLHSLHFNINIFKNASNANDNKIIKGITNEFLYDNNLKIDAVISELNDFKAKLDEMKKCHSSLLPKALDNKLKIESKYDSYMEQLYFIHKRQKSALISTIKLFLKLAKSHVNNLKRFK